MTRHVLRGTIAGAAAMLALAGTLGRPSPAAPPAPVPPSFHIAAQTGDLVMRRGHSLASRTVLLSDREGTYSHVGIALRRGDSVWVVHVAPASDIDRGWVVREPLDLYLAADRAAAGALYRPTALSGSARDTLAAVLGRYVAGRIPFDGAFDLATEDRLYCTELVWLAFRSAGIDLLPRGAPARSTPFGTRSYVFPSDLAAAPGMRPVATFERSSPSR